MLVDGAYSLLQVLVLALNPSFGWSAGLLSWLEGISITNLLLPNRDPGEFWDDVQVSYCCLYLVPHLSSFGSAIQCCVRCDGVGGGIRSRRRCMCVLFAPQLAQCTAVVCGIHVVDPKGICIGTAHQSTDVAYMFKSQNFKHIWPLKLLRLMVSLLVTAGFVPTFGVIITPFSCQAMQQCVKLASRTHFMGHWR